MNVREQITALRDVKTSRTVTCRFCFCTFYTLPAYTHISLQSYSTTKYEIHINRVSFAESAVFYNKI